MFDGKIVPSRTITALEEGTIMTKTPEAPTKKVSRRDAIKILTAVAGATALANTPARWSKPELKVGVLPVHAQTSVVTPVYTLTADADEPVSFCGNQTIQLNSTATISPVATGILLRFTITSTGVTVTPPLTGTVATNASGMVSLSIDTDGGNSGNDNEVTIVWSFENSSQGTNTDSQQFIQNGC
jgi:hypothetical protein